MKPPLEDPWQHGESFASFLTRRGVSRRDFLSFCGKMAVIIGAGAATAAPKVMAKELAAKVGAAQRPNVVYLQLQECTGCAESLLRSGSSPVDELVLEQVSLNYSELLMAAAGKNANEALAAADKEPHLLIVNGSVPLKDHGIYCTIGGESAEAVLRRSAQNATAILAVGACAEYGCVQAGAPNPTGAVGVGEVIKDRPVVNVSGCPPIPEIITATITYYLAYGRTPPVDGLGRPLFAYGQRIHDKCPRRASTERQFYDRMTPFYRRLPDVVVPGLGVETSANTVGAALVGLSYRLGCKGPATWLVQERNPLRGRLTQS